MNEHPYRELAIREPPKTWIGLVWSWLLLRREDRLKPIHVNVRYSIHMVRATHNEGYEPKKVQVTTCPGKSAPRPSDVYSMVVYDYWLCDKNHCCCELVNPRDPA